MQEKTAQFLSLIRALQKVDPEFPLHYALCLAEIARDEGLSLTRLASRTGLALPTVSRIAGALSRHRRNGPAYGLIRMTVSTDERRRKELYLTRRGRNVMKNVTDILASGNSSPIL